MLGFLTKRETNRDPNFRDLVYKNLIKNDFGETALLNYEPSTHSLPKYYETLLLTFLNRMLFENPCYLGPGSCFDTDPKVKFSIFFMKKIEEIDYKRLQNEPLILSDLRNLAIGYLETMGFVEHLERVLDRNWYPDIGILGITAFIKTKVLTQEERDNLRLSLVRLAGRGMTESVRILLDAGVDPNYLSDMSTPLYQATYFNRIETVKLLLEAGADPSMKHESGKTPYEIAVKFEYTEIMEILEQDAANLPDAFSSCHIQ